MRRNDFLSKNNIKNKNKLNDTEPDYRYYFICFIICAVFLFLFAVRIHVDVLSGKSLNLFSSSNGLYADWFLYCKEMLFVATAVIILLYFIGEKIFPDNPCRHNPILTKQAHTPVSLMGLYLLMSVISATFSENKDVVLFGVCTEYEGISIILAYGVLFFAGYNYFTGNKVRQFYKRAFFFLIVVTVILALFEYTVKPLLELSFMKYIIAPAKYRSVAESLKITDTFREAVLMFFNSNYMGGFCTIIFPVSVYYIISTEKNISKIICGIVSAACFITVIMSNSTAALYVTLAELLFLVVFLTAKRVIKLKSLILIISAFAILSGGISIASGNEFVDNIIKSFTNTGTYSETEKSFRLDSIQISGNDIYFRSKDSEYKITAPVKQGEILNISGGENTLYTLAKTDNNTISVHDIELDSDFTVILRNGIIYLDVGYMSTIDFAVTSEAVKLIVQNKILLDKIPVSPFNDTCLADFYRFATGRGYIWINTLPILKDCFIIGKGAGNFPFCFVQNEIVGLAGTNGSYRIIVDKPHNWYMQIAVTSGIPAMLAVLILFGRFGISCFRSFIMTDYEKLTADKNKYFLLCLFTGLCGFMVIGLVNDSSVTVNPFFWLNFGVAMCWNDNIRKENCQ